MHTIKAAAIYFAITFGAGFVLGTIRTLCIMPRVGERKAELMEAPLMLAVTILTARWSVACFKLPFEISERLEMGCIALGFLLAAEFSTVRLVRRMSIRRYFATRDPVSGLVYCALLAVFAIMPVLVSRQ